MKKIIILSVAILLSAYSFAQRIHSIQSQSINYVNQNGYGFHHSNTSAKTTANGDTAILKHISSTDTIKIYTVGTGDSGYVTGTNYWGDMAFAERYDYNDDSGRTMQVIGLFALFKGKVNPASVKSVTFTLWDEGPEQAITSTRFYKSFPNNVLDTVTIPITQIGIGTSTDTLKSYLFATPGNYYSSFFAGYSINYNFATLNGDTIGLASSKNGERTESSFQRKSYLKDSTSTVIDSATDTIYYVQNATLGSDNLWYDNYTQNDSILNNLAVYPVVISGFKESVKGITRNNFTYYGNYPNPADNSTNIKFALSASVDVTVQIMDMGGRIINTIKQTNLTTGEHVIPVNTANLPAGDYLYLIRTSGGDGIAGKMIKN